MLIGDDQEKELLKNEIKHILDIRVDHLCYSITGDLILLARFADWNNVKYGQVIFGWFV